MRMQSTLALDAQFNFSNSNTHQREVKLLLILYMELN